MDPESCEVDAWRDANSPNFLDALTDQEWTKIHKASGGEIAERAMVAGLLAQYLMERHNTKRASQVKKSLQRLSKRIDGVTRELLSLVQYKYLIDGRIHWDADYTELNSRLEAAYDELLPLNAAIREEVENMRVPLGAPRKGPILDLIKSCDRLWKQRTGSGLSTISKDHRAYAFCSAMVFSVEPNLKQSTFDTYLSAFVNQKVAESGQP